MTKRQRQGYIAAMAILLVAFVVMGCAQRDTTQSENAASGSDTVSTTSVTLAADENGLYAPREIRVKLGSAVRIEGDPETLAGGMDTVIIDGYSVRKRIAPGDNVIAFTADKAGTFLMYCANGMGDGKLVVEP